MAFAGDAGAAAGQLAIATLSSPLTPFGGSVAYDANNNLEVRNAAGTRIHGGGEAVGPNGLIDSLLIDLGTAAGPSYPLAAWVNGTFDGTAADTGVLVTAAPAANQHGLPVNFGPGRGNWSAGPGQSSLGAVEAHFLEMNHLALSPANIGNVRLAIYATGADVTFVVKNMSNTNLSSMVLLLKYNAGQNR